MKTIHTPRDELICGVLDAIAERCSYDMIALTLVEQARTMAERMEAKLYVRKQDADDLAQGCTVKAEAVA